MQYFISFLEGKIDVFDDGGTRKIPPALIMPRGIGARHFSCVNNLSGYSASGVDLYVKNGNKLCDDTLSPYKGLTAPYVVDYYTGKYERVEDIRFK